jgi:predicted ferric reductase
MWTALARSTGIVATILMLAALAWGFLFTAHETGRRLRPAWWLDLHNWLGGLALVFTVAHIVVAWADPAAGIGVLEALVPAASSVNRWPITWGVIAAYLMAAAVFTTWPRRWHNRQAWRIVHLGTVVAAALAVIHGVQLGTDAPQWWYLAGVVILVGGSTYPLGLRLFGQWRPRHSQPAPSQHPPSPNDDVAH